MKENYRIEKDSLGEIKVPTQAKWGAQTQRSLENFDIGKDKMPMEIIHALTEIKRSAAKINCEYKKISEDKRYYIMKACDEILSGNADEEFPLSVWQTGSGTQTNMNVNEVIAHLTGGKVHPNDDVNASQSSNDVFPTAMHLAAVEILYKKVVPAIENGIEAFTELQNQYPKTIKIGRTHLQDAVPLYFKDEVSGWKEMLIESRDQIIVTLPFLQKIALGGTAVGTGLNAPKGFSRDCTREISKRYGIVFQPAKNKFHSLTSKDALVFSHGALKGLAANLFKIANDIRFMASGPRCGYGEIEIPSNEPGSSIMPGKVNPTQAEALSMVCIEVMGNDTAIGLAASQGNFELNVYMPLIIHNFLRSAHLLADGLNSFVENCVLGIKVLDQMEQYVEDSLMLVTALSKSIGYEKAAEVAKKAYEEDKSLKETVLELGYLEEEEIEEALDPKKMV